LNLYLSEFVKKKSDEKTNVLPLFTTFLGCFALHT